MGKWLNFWLVLISLLSTGSISDGKKIAPLHAAGKTINRASNPRNVIATVVAAETQNAVPAKSPDANDKMSTGNAESSKVERAGRYINMDELKDVFDKVATFAKTMQGDNSALAEAKQLMQQHGFAAPLQKVEAPAQDEDQATVDSGNKSPMKMSAKRSLSDVTSSTKSLVNSLIDTLKELILPPLEAVQKSVKSAMGKDAGLDQQAYQDLIKAFEDAKEAAASNGASSTKAEENLRQQVVKLMGQLGNFGDGDKLEAPAEIQQLLSVFLGQSIGAPAQDAKEESASRHKLTGRSLSDVASNTQSLFYSIIDTLKELILPPLEALQKSVKQAAGMDAGLENSYQDLAKAIEDAKAAAPANTVKAVEKIEEKYTKLFAQLGKFVNSDKMEAPANAGEDSTNGFLVNVTKAVQQVILPHIERLQNGIKETIDKYASLDKAYKDLVKAIEDTKAATPSDSIKAVEKVREEYTKVIDQLGKFAKSDKLEAPANAAEDSERLETASRHKVAGRSLSDITSNTKDLVSSVIDTLKELILPPLEAIQKSVKQAVGMDAGLENAYQDLVKAIEDAKMAAPSSSIKAVEKVRDEYTKVIGQLGKFVDSDKLEAPANAGEESGSRHKVTGRSLSDITSNTKDLINSLIDTLKELIMPPLEAIQKSVKQAAGMDGGIENTYQGLVAAIKDLKEVAPASSIKTEDEVRNELTKLFGKFVNGDKLEAPAEVPQLGEKTGAPTQGADDETEALGIPEAASRPKVTGRSLSDVTSNTKSLLSSMYDTAKELIMPPLEAIQKSVKNAMGKEAESEQNAANGQAGSTQQQARYYVDIAQAPAQQDSGNDNKNGGIIDDPDESSTLLSISTDIWATTDSDIDSESSESSESESYETSEEVEDHTEVKRSSPDEPEQTTEMSEQQQPEESTTEAVQEIKKKKKKRRKKKKKNKLVNGTELEDQTLAGNGTEETAAGEELKKKRRKKKKKRTTIRPFQTGRFMGGNMFKPLNSIPKEIGDMKSLDPMNITGRTMVGEGRGLLRDAIKTTVFGKSSEAACPTLGEFIGSITRDSAFAGYNAMFGSKVKEQSLASKLYGVFTLCVKQYFWEAVAWLKQQFKAMFVLAPKDPKQPQPKEQPKEKPKEQPKEPPKEPPKEQPKEDADEMPEVRSGKQQSTSSGGGGWWG